MKNMHQRLRSCTHTKRLLLIGVLSMLSFAGLMSPANAQISAQKPEVTFATATMSGEEGKVIKVKVNVTGEYNGNILFEVTGTATRNSDFKVPDSVRAPFPQNTSSTVFVNVLSDAEVEGDETIILTLKPDTSNAYTVGSQKTCTLTIKGVQDSEAVRELRQIVLEGTEVKDKTGYEFNNDGQIDVADLVKKVQTGNFGVPAVRFDKASSTAVEGNHAVNIRVNLSSHFKGQINYLVTAGTATAGSDYEGASGTVDVDGVFVMLPVTLKDDAIREPLETLDIWLEADPANTYRVDAPSRHTVTIDENDALWHGTLRDGLLTVGFELLVLQNGGTFQAFLDSDGKKDGSADQWLCDGTNGIPAGSWDVKSAIQPDNFSVEIGPITYAKESSRLNTEFIRTLTLQANAGTAKHRINWRSRIQGQLQDTFSAQTTALFTLPGSSATELENLKSFPAEFITALTRVSDQSFRTINDLFTAIERQMRRNLSSSEQAALTTHVQEMPRSFLDTSIEHGTFTLVRQPTLSADPQ